MTPQNAIVLYIAGEGGAEGAALRMRAWAIKHGFNRATMRDRFRLITAGINLMSKDDVCKLMSSCQRRLAKDEGRLALIVIDTINTATAGAEENSAKEMGAFFRICRLMGDSSNPLCSASTTPTKRATRAARSC